MHRDPDLAEQSNFVWGCQQCQNSHLLFIFKTGTPKSIQLFKNHAIKQNFKTLVSQTDEIYLLYFISNKHSQIQTKVQFQKGEEQKLMAHLVGVFGAEVLDFSSWEGSSNEEYRLSVDEFVSIVKFNSWLLLPLLLSLLQSVLSRLSESLFPPAPPPLGSPFILFVSAFCCARDICWSGKIICTFWGVSLVLFFLFFRLVLGVVTTLALFFPKTFVKVADVAEIPIVVVVVALGGSIGTSCST